MFFIFTTSISLDLLLVAYRFCDCFCRGFVHFVACCCVLVSLIVSWLLAVISCRFVLLIVLSSRRAGRLVPYWFACFRLAVSSCLCAFCAVVCVAAVSVCCLLCVFIPSVFDVLFHSRRAFCEVMSCLLAVAFVSTKSISFDVVDECVRIGINFVSFRIVFLVRRHGYSSTNRRDG